MELIYKKAFDFFEMGDVLSFSWTLIIIVLIMVFKFIYKNNIESTNKISEFNNDALKVHLEVMNDIFMYKNQKVDNIYLITSLNKLQYYNNRNYLNLLRGISTYNLRTKLTEIETFISQNINYLKKEQNLVINFDNLNSLEKLSRYFNNIKISIFINSLISTLLILYFSAFFLNIILLLEKTNNFFFKTYFFIFIIFIYFTILLIYFKISNYINEKNYHFACLIFILNFILVCSLTFAFKFEFISNSPALKFILILIASIISFIFSIKVDYIILKFRNLKPIKIKENLNI